MMKFGEALIKEGLITRQQLDLALQRQVQFGGRVGTNLLELRILREDELLKFLSKYFRVPSVGPEMITSISEEAVNAVSRDLVEKYRILPFKLERKRLHAAVLNPKEMKEIDELRFMTGFDIIPYVITEMRLLYALEKYYGIRRELRFISMTDRFSPEAAVEKAEDTVEQIKTSFADVKQTEEIAGILLKESYKIATRAAVFTVKGGKVAAWKSRGLDLEGFSIAAEGSEPSIFRDVLKSRNYYRGPVLNIRGNEPLVQRLMGTPQDALLMPINIRERTVGLLYVDNGNKSVLDANVGYLSRLVSMAGIAFEIMILRRKIFEL